jgi:hypothetical protein
VRCAEVSLLDEPLAGTAPVAAALLLVEHSGPWGEHALAEAGLDPLEERCKARGVKLLLVRRADRTPPGGRVLAVGCAATPFAVEVGAGETESAVEALGRGERPAGADAGRLWLVCTNGKRDACCALEGLPVARELARLRPQEAWECSHLGGHRFAANVLLLPEGICFGRVSAEDVAGVVAGAERDELPLELVRGRMALAPAAQAAELAARSAGAIRTLAALPVALDGTAASVAGVHVDLVEEPLPPRPVSCGAAPEPVSVWRARVREA